MVCSMDSLLDILIAKLNLILGIWKKSKKIDKFDGKSQKKLTNSTEKVKKI